MVKAGGIGWMDKADRFGRMTTK